MTVLKAQDISITIGAKTICEKLSFEIGAGEIWGILGANGSGKTTLLSSLIRLHTLQSGRVYVEDVCLSRFTPVELAKYLGILFQEMSTAFPQTVWDYCLGARYPHLGFLKRNSEEDIAIAYESLCSMDLETYAERNIQQLSGGEKRRLGIAALLTQRPKIYLLDEPANHLDLRYQVAVFKRLQSIAQQQPAAVMMAMHDINLASAYCSHLLMLMPDGSTLHGGKEVLLSEKNLRELYQCEIKQFSNNGKIYWYL